MSEGGVSTQQVLTSLIANGVIFGAFLSVFLLLRLKLKRNYEPKSTYDLISDEKKPEPLPPGLWQWFLPLLKKSDNFLIQQAGLDGYFFLRYLFLICAYCSISALYIFPILFAVNATNENGQNGLDVLGFQNVNRPGRYYAHVFCGWVFFWMFMFVVYRELYFYNSLRQAVLSSPRYASKISSKTVLFQTVPQQYLSESEFSKLFDGVKRVWIARGGHHELEKKIAQRDDLVNKLENALNSYIKKAIKQVGKLKKKNPEISISSDITQYVPEKDRPTHKKKPIIGQKYDTIKYATENIPLLNREIETMQADSINADPFNSVFVEFESQYQAQVASQVATYHVPLALAPAYIGIEPDQVVWLNMRMFWWERIARNLGGIAIIIALLCFWSIPVAFIGMISNVNYLIDQLHWLEFLRKLPEDLFGLLTSLAPTVALAWLMSFLPTFIRMVAKFYGCASLQLVEYFAQQSYFGFQVIQVFLITTLSSSVTSTAVQIAQTPTNAMGLLAGNLPKSSNFFISYIILTGMSISSGTLAQIIPVFFYYVFGYLFDNTPRKKYSRFTDLDAPSWGTTFPVYTNLAVIIFAYSVISPIILLFGAAGFFLLYVAYLYTLMYVQKEAPDLRGICYPRALFQTLVGVYLGQVCLLGLFSVGKGWGPIVLQVVGIIVTVLLHLKLNDAFDSLMHYVPVDTMKPLDGKSDTPSFKNIYREESSEDEIKELPRFSIRKYEPRNSMAQTDKMSSLISDRTIEIASNTKYNEKSENHITWVPLLADGPSGTIPHAPFYKRFFLPHIYYSYKAVKAKLPEIYGLADPDLNTSEEDLASAYNYPAINAKCPSVWIPRDPYGFSLHQVDELNTVVDISDVNATIDGNGNIWWKAGPPSAESIYDDDPFSDENVTPL
ncbi:hypothetical protein HG535_0F00480 [Zygotorulaspora mrakii]|uniref:CSC1/OSCA1-like 7TM region domain-containing protein n=1 Tax=Zygotorulaspora mrakii TaxID=42260 RepID=A0A7H9B4C3_ZYGMR|nr:uncharacterized protein HG535_0F00480 [Zygotorulaspora mrakii]QLG73538.1 hypothetical protein HG535_0F00480 [Zygotorulaspora mrakii]